MSFVVHKEDKRRKGMVFNHLIFPLIVFSHSLSVLAVLYCCVTTIFVNFSLWNSTNGIIYLVWNRNWCVHTS